jgi:hypothetical protein
MDEDTYQYFKMVIKKDLKDLTDEEKGFLKARRSYLSKAETEKFSELLKLNHKK